MQVSRFKFTPMRSPPRLESSFQEDVNLWGVETSKDDPWSKMPTPYIPIVFSLNSTRIQPEFKANSAFNDFS